MNLEETIINLIGVRDELARLRKTEEELRSKIMKYMNGKEFLEYKNIIAVLSGNETAIFSADDLRRCDLPKATINKFYHEVVVPRLIVGFKDK